MRSPAEFSRATFGTQPGYVYASDPKLRFDQKRLASLVGFAAFGLPIVLALGAVVYRLVFDRESELLAPSISAFYYREIVLGDFFVGTLVFIGTLLLAFRGWNRNVSRLSSVAGLFAFGVALFPTCGWRMVGTRPAPIEGDWIGWAHNISAAGLFAILAYFCLSVFTLVEDNNVHPSGQPFDSKAARNRIYVGSGIVIVAMLLTILIGSQLLGKWSALKLTFWCEAIALFAFGVSWTTLGRAMNSLLLDPRDKRDRAKVRQEEDA